MNGLADYHSNSSEQNFILLYIMSKGGLLCHINESLCKALFSISILYGIIFLNKKNSNNRNHLNGKNYIYLVSKIKPHQLENLNVRLDVKLLIQWGLPQISRVSQTFYYPKIGSPQESHFPCLYPFLFPTIPIISGAI